MDVVHWATDLQGAIVRRLAGQRKSIANHDDDDVKVQEKVLKNHIQTCMFVANGSFSWKMHSLGCFPDSKQRCCTATPARQLPRSALGQTLCADPQRAPPPATKPAFNSVTPIRPRRLFGWRRISSLSFHNRVLYVVVPPIFCMPRSVSQSVRYTCLT
jgi:hypothetical protein